MADVVIAAAPAPDPEVEAEIEGAGTRQLRQGVISTIVLAVLAAGVLMAVPGLSNVSHRLDEIDGRLDRAGHRARAAVLPGLCPRLPAGLPSCAAALRGARRLVAAGVRRRRARGRRRRRRRRRLDLPRQGLCADPRRGAHGGALPADERRQRDRAGRSPAWPRWPAWSRHPEALWLSLLPAALGLGAIVGFAVLARVIPRLVARRADRGAAAARPPVCWAWPAACARPSGS